MHLTLHVAPDRSAVSLVHADVAPSSTPAPYVYAAHEFCVQVGVPDTAASTAAPPAHDTVASSPVHPAMHLTLHVVPCARLMPEAHADVAPSSTPAPYVYAAHSGTHGCSPVVVSPAAASEAHVIIASSTNTAVLVNVPAVVAASSHSAFVVVSRISGSAPTHVPALSAQLVCPVAQATPSQTPTDAYPTSHATLHVAPAANGSAVTHPFVVPPTTPTPKE